MIELCSLPLPSRPPRPNSSRQSAISTTRKRDRRPPRTRDGIVIGGDSRQRAFTGTLAELIRVRDHDRCREPYCDAPIRELDHIRRRADGGPTTFDNGRGLCTFHNQVRETPGWRATGSAEAVTTTTPTGHTYTSGLAAEFPFDVARRGYAVGAAVLAIAEFFPRQVMHLRQLLSGSP